MNAVHNDQDEKTRTIDLPILDVMSSRTLDLDHATNLGYYFKYALSFVWVNHCYSLLKTQCRPLNNPPQATPRHLLAHCHLACLHLALSPLSAAQQGKGDGGPSLGQSEDGSCSQRRCHLHLHLSLNLTPSCALAPALAPEQHQRRRSSSTAPHHQHLPQHHQQAPRGCCAHHHQHHLAHHHHHHHQLKRSQLEKSGSLVLPRPSYQAVDPPRPQMAHFGQPMFSQKNLRSPTSVPWRRTRLTVRTIVIVSERNDVTCATERASNSTCSRRRGRRPSQGIQYQDWIRQLGGSRWWDTRGWWRDGRDGRDR